MKQKLAHIIVIVGVSLGCTPSVQDLNKQAALCLQSQYWYFFYKDDLGAFNDSDLSYYEWVFSSDKVYTYQETLGSLLPQPYQLINDTLKIGEGGAAHAYLVSNCQSDQVTLVSLLTSLDTIILRPYDMTYWVDHLEELPKSVVAHRDPINGDVLDRGFAMRLKEGIINVEDSTESTGEQNIEYFEHE